MGDAPSGRLAFLDGLRGIAAFWVVLFHASAGGHLEALKARLPAPVVKVVFDAGHDGVAIFFVLSGFVIAHSLLGKEVDGGFFLRFALRRSVRLDPPYWGSIVLVLALAFVSARVKGEAFVVPSWEALFAHLTYTQTMAGVPQLNSVFWTLPYELQFYLVFCLLLGVAQAFDRRGLRGSALVFVPAFAVGLAWPLQVFQENVHPGVFLDLWFAFAMGVLACWSARGLADTRLFLAFLAAVTIAGLIRLDDFTLVAAATAGLLRFASHAQKQGSWLRWRWLQFLGAISYSLYLTHNPVGGAAFFITRKVLGTSWAAELAALVAVSAISVACAWLFWLALERPSLALARRVRLQRDA